METDIGAEVTVETSSEQDSIFKLESHSVNNVTEISNTELVQSAVDTEADNQRSMEISIDLKEDRVQGLFAPFSHHMKPDPEYVRFELEMSAPDQEAATKLINDRYKWIMEVAARRKEKKQKDKMKFKQISHNVDHEKVVEIAQSSHYVDIENIKETTQLLHNMHLTPSSLTKDQSKEFSDNHLQEIYWHNGLNRFFKENYVGMLNTVTEHHDCRVEDELRQARNEQKDGEKRKTFSEVSQKLDSPKGKKANRIFRDENKLIGSSFEELLDTGSESLYEI